MLTEAEIAWVAGLLEGEGSFGLGAISQGKQGGEKARQLRVTCAMTDYDVLLKLKKLCGGAIYPIRMDSRYPSAKAIWQWALSKRKEVVPLLEILRPCMMQRRSAKIGELLQYAADHPLKYKGLVHGTRNGYKWWKCRCDQCRKATNDYARNHRKAKKDADQTPSL